MKSRRMTVLALAALLLAGCSSSNPYQGMSDEEIFAYARQHYEQGDWDRAIQALDRLFAAYGASDLLAEARLLQSHAYYEKGDYLTARSEYERFIDRYPGHQNAAVAALGICRSLVALSPIPQRDQQYTQDALVVCRNVVSDYAGTDQSQEAARLSNEMRVKLAEKEFLNADFYFRRELYDSAIKYYEFVVQLFPETEFAPRALLGIYEANKAIGYDDLAEDARERLLEQYPESPEAGSVRVNDSVG